MNSVVLRLHLGLDRRKSNLNKKICKIFRSWHYIDNEDILEIKEKQPFEDAALKS